MSTPTPAYILEEASLIKNLILLHKVQKESGCHILLSLKAFSLWPLFPLIKKYLSGGAASSLNEAELIHHEMGCLAHTYSPAFDADEIQNIARHSSHIIFNSLHQFKQFKDQLTAHKLGIRVNPMISVVPTDHYNPATKGARLGTTQAEFGKHLPEGLSGLHFHALCESSASDFEKVLLGFESQFKPFLPHLEWVNFGGGHLITKKGYDIDHFISIIQDFKQKYNLEVFIEPGSAIAWEIGNLTAKILDIVSNNGIQTAILNISFTAHMPDTLEMPYRPVVLESIPLRKDAYIYNLGGISCLSGDYIADYAFAKPLKIGDQITFADMLHYTTVKTTLFNGVQHPDIYLKKKDGVLQLLKTFSYADYKNRMC